MTDLIEEYDASYHKTIECSPIEVNKSYETEIRELLQTATRNVARVTSRPDQPDIHIDITLSSSNFGSHSYGTSFKAYSSNSDFDPTISPQRSRLAKIMDGNPGTSWPSIHLSSSSPITSDMLTIPVISESQDTTANLPLFLNTPTAKSSIPHKGKVMPNHSYHDLIKAQDVSQESRYDISLQRHLISSTTSPEASADPIQFGNNKKCSSSSYLDVTTDASFPATDPKNIFMSPEFRQSSSETKGNAMSLLLEDSVLKTPIPAPYVTMSPSHSHSQLNDIIPTLPKIPLAGIEVQANLPNVVDLTNEGLLDIPLPSPALSSVPTSSNITSRSKVSSQHNSGDLANVTYMQDSLLTSSDSLNTPSVRLFPDMVAPRGTPAVRLLPTAASSLSPRQSATSGLDNASSNNFDVQCHSFIGSPLKIYPLKQNQSQPQQFGNNQSKFIYVNSESSNMKGKETFLLTGPSALNSFPKPETKLIYQQRNILDLGNGTNSVSFSPVLDDLRHQNKPEKDSQLASSSKTELRIEPVSCFKCSQCGYLATSMKNVKEHMNEEHDADLEGSDESLEWLSVAQREMIGQECPMCPNQFFAESSRSFKIHMTDDHGQTEENAAEQFRLAFQIRKEKTLELIKKKRLDERIRRKKAKKDGLEAYLDESGELRVRNILQVSDMTAKEFAKETIFNKQSKKDIGEKKKSFSSKPNSACIDKDEVKPRSSIKRSRVGRPCGSRTIGMTKLRKLNPDIALSEERIGSECLVNDCAVRMVDSGKLSYHRICHKPDKGFTCLECQDDFEKWQDLSLHLWRRHKLDMELYSCNQCDTFRSFTQTKLKIHMLTHQKERPYLCDFCGKGFKTIRNMKVHKELHAIVKMESAKTIKGTCDICQRTFSELRLLKLHMDTVHKKLKPHLCNFCGYSASSKSSLKLHLRLHTGEKPYFCQECDYRSADHNSLRRHKMRHSGEKPYKCPKCSYSSIQSSTYIVHLRTKHPDDYEKLVFSCSICSFKTVKRGNYLSHLTEHQDKDGGMKDAKNTEVDTKPLQSIISQV